MIRAHAVTALMATASLAACVRAPGPPAAPTPPAAVEAMPTLRVEQLQGAELPPGVDLERTAQDPVEGERITLTAADADLRALLAALASAAGVNLVVTPEVDGRVTVNFTDVPAMTALRRLLVETGFMIVEPLVAPWGPTVFYVAPVNVDEADVALLRARFGVSEEVARFVVRTRIPPN